MLIAHCSKFCLYFEAAISPVQSVRTQRALRDYSHIHEVAAIFILIFLRFVAPFLPPLLALHNIHSISSAARMHQFPWHLVSVLLPLSGLSAHLIQIYVIHFLHYLIDLSQRLGFIHPLHGPTHHHHLR